MTKALQVIDICIHIFWEKGQWETGHWEMEHFKMFQGRRDISIIWEIEHPSIGGRTAPHQRKT